MRVSHLSGSDRLIGHHPLFSVLTSICLSLAASSHGWTQEPVVTGLSAGAVLPGQTTRLELRGSNLQSAKGLWLSFPAQVTLVTEGGKAPKADLVAFDVTTSSDVTPGIHGVRVLTATGVSPLRFLLVDDLPSVAQAGDATTLESAQSLTIPVAVDGVIPSLGTRYFKLEAKAGQKLAMEVLARRIGSPLDSMLRLLDSSGRELAFNDDAPGQSGDSQICHQFTADGTYIVELRDIRYQDGAYRLRIGDFPCVSTSYPLAATRGQTVNVELAGLNSESLPAVAVNIPADAGLSAVPVSAKREGGQNFGFSTIALADRPQFLEAEPNNTAEQANVCELTHDVNGRLQQSGDVDRFRFKATKNSSYVFTGLTRTQGSPADLVLQILKPDGSELARVDDTGVDEGTVTAKFLDDGEYTLVVQDLSRRGGSDYTYRIAIAEPAPSFSLTCNLESWTIPAGGSAFATVTAKRNGYTGPIELQFEGLPVGVTASQSVIGPGRTDAVLTLTATPEVSAGEMHPLRLKGTGNNGAIVASADIAAALKTRYPALRYAPQHLSDSLTMAVGTAPGFQWKLDPPVAVIGKQLSTTVKLVAGRQEGYSDAITVALQPAQNGVPAGITVAVKPIEKSKNEVEITVAADDKAPLGDFTVGLLGTLKKDKQTVVQPLALRISVAAPLTVTADAGESKLATGQELPLKVVIQRNPSAKGPVELSVANLPKGVTAAAVTAPSEATEAVLTLKAAGDAAKGLVKNLQVKAALTAGKAKFEAVSANVAITVE